MTDLILIPRELFAFLCGDGPLDGNWFGEKPEHEDGRFWWRRHLRAADNRMIDAETIKGIILAFIDADDATHWGDFEKALDAAISDPHTLQRLGQEFDAGEACTTCGKGAGYYQHAPFDENHHEFAQSRGQAFDGEGVADADREAADAISVALLQCVPPDIDLTHFRLSVADLFARHRLQSVAAATANLQNRIDELTNEAEIFAADHVDQNRMVDRIAGLIGLPHDQELDTVAFELWISAQTAATAAKDAVALPQDVVSLVIAAREAWEAMESDGIAPKRAAALDRALLPFSGRVPYDDEPEGEE